MPLKVNYAGVMPSSLRRPYWSPSTIAGMASRNLQELRSSSRCLCGLAALHALWRDDLFLQLLLGGDQFQPQQIADDLKKYGGYIPGVRPGRPTADFSTSR
jgi:preprotein translocase subunit SecY